MLTQWWLPTQKASLDSCKPHTYNPPANRDRRPHPCSWEDMSYTPSTKSITLTQPCSAAYLLDMTSPGGIFAVWYVSRNYFEVFSGCRQYSLGRTAADSSDLKWPVKGHMDWRLVSHLNPTLMFFLEATCNLEEGTLIKIKSPLAPHNILREIFSCSQDWPWTCYGVEGDLELLILLPPSPECWDYSNTPPHLIYVLLRI